MYTVNTETHKAFRRQPQQGNSQTARFINEMAKIDSMQCACIHMCTITHILRHKRLHSVLSFFSLYTVHQCCITATASQWRIWKVTFKWTSEWERVCWVKRASCRSTDWCRRVITQAWGRSTHHCHFFCLFYCIFLFLTICIFAMMLKRIFPLTSDFYFVFLALSFLSYFLTFYLPHMQLMCNVCDL